MTNIFDTHKYVTQTFLLYGALSDHIACKDLVIRSSEQYLVKLLKSRGYEHVIFYGDAQTKGAYTLDAISARFFFPENLEIPFPERWDPTEDDAETSAGGGTGRTGQNADGQTNTGGARAISSSNRTSLGGIVGRNRRRTDRYQPGADPTRSEAMPDAGEDQAGSTGVDNATAPRRVRYSLRKMELEFFYQLIHPLMLNESSKMAVVFYDIFTSGMSTLNSLKDHILYNWNELAGKNICVLMAPETNNSEIDLVNAIRSMGLGQKFLRDKDAHSVSLDPMCCYKIGKPCRDEIENLLNRLKIVGSKGRRKFCFAHRDLEVLADEVLYCARTITVGGVALDGINQIFPRLESFLDRQLAGRPVELTTDLIDQIWGVPERPKTAKQKNMSRQQTKEPADWTVRRFQISEDTGTTPARPFDEVMKELDELIGLKNVKKQVRRQMHLAEANHNRIAMGFPSDQTSLHMVFRGKPGTGKTTVARMIGELYHSLGLLRKGHVKEVSGKDLIAGFLGQTAAKTNDVIQEAYGGVLFIDEAYSITEDNDNSFGKDVINTLVQAMENKRDDLAVIVAGYPKKMDQFIESNEGLKSRFHTFIDFEDYTLDELMKILEFLCRKKQLVITPDAIELVRKQLQGEMLEDDFGNGRDVRNLLDDAIANQASRIAGKMDLSAQELQQITADDIPLSSRLKGKKTKEELLEELRKMIGLARVKQEVESQMNLIQLNQARIRQGKTEQKVSLHMVFEGAPGTGKTTVARMVGELYRSMGLLRKGHVVEVSGKDLIAGYVGQTATKTNDVIQEALGGVLFIDEAYSITESGANSFGKDAVNTLVQVMENKLDDLVVIAAGYPQEMERFLKSNSGLKSRFGTIIHFDSYSMEELMGIFDSMCEKNQITPTEEAREKVRQVLQAELDEPEFGNGRAVRNLYEKMLLNQANRYKATGSEEAVNSFVASDVPTPGGSSQQKKTKEDLLTELDQVVGLENVKKQVRAQMERIEINRMRRSHGLPELPFNMNMVFLGNPGTGKTMVARLIGELYREIGVLRKGHVVEVSRSDLVAGYVGQTALKTEAVIKSALGGVLFIDEAYSIIAPGENDFGKEAIDTLVRFMDDYRTDLTVIAAGYPNEMRRFINANPGLLSRLTNFIDFADYNLDELMRILAAFCQKHQYVLDEEAKQSARLLIAQRMRDPGFANGRGVRNLFEAAIRKQGNRILRDGLSNDTDIVTLTAADFEEI